MVLGERICKIEVRGLAWNDGLGSHRRRIFHDTRCEVFSSPMQNVNKEGQDHVVTSFCLRTRAKIPGAFASTVSSCYHASIPCQRE